MDTAKTITHLSLCTGYGGIDLGLKRILPDVRTIAYVEIEAFAVHNLVAKIEKGWLDAAPIWTDLKTFGWSNFRGKVDILSGGFPCQPFSGAGRRRGDEDPRHLWPHIVKGIRELGGPPVVFFENVEGIISSKLKSDGWSDPEGTSVLLHVLRELERLGYKATAGVFSAEEVGAPHRRKRVFIMGISSSRVLKGSDGRGLPFKEGVGIQTRESNTAYPAGRGAGQHAWEPPRISELVNSSGERLEGALWAQPQVKSRGPAQPDTELGDSLCKRREGCKSFEGEESKEGWETSNRQCAYTSLEAGELQRETEPSLGGVADGGACRVDLAKLYRACDNRTDELRMLGNGVVPDCAALAFDVLYNRLKNRH